MGKKSFMLTLSVIVRFFAQHDAEQLNYTLVKMSQSQAVALGMRASRAIIFHSLALTKQNSRYELRSH